MLGPSEWRVIGIGMGFDEDAGDADRDRGGAPAPATNSRSPPDDAPCPPGCCTEWVASKMTGAPVVRARIGSARMSDTSVL